jgi:hypothetical protein
VPDSYCSHAVLCREKRVKKRVIAAVGELDPILTEETALASPDATAPQVRAASQSSVETMHRLATFGVLALLVPSASARGQESGGSLRLLSITPSSDSPVDSNTVVMARLSYQIQSFEPKKFIYTISDVVENNQLYRSRLAKDTKDTMVERLIKAGGLRHLRVDPTRITVLGEAAGRVVVRTNMAALWHRDGIARPFQLSWYLFRTPLAKLRVDETRGLSIFTRTENPIAEAGPVRFVTQAIAVPTESAPTVRREVFAEHPTINVVYTIARMKRDGGDGVLIVGGGTSGSTSCFVPSGGGGSCTSLKLASVDAAQLIGSHDPGGPSLLVQGLWGEPAIALLDRNGNLAWRYDAKFTAMGHFAVLAGDGPEAVIADRNKGLLFFNAMTGKLRSTVRLPGVLDGVFGISGSDGHPYLMGLTGAGQVVVLTTAGEVVRASPNIGVFHAAASPGDNPVLFIAPRDTLYTLDQQFETAGGWYAPQSADLHISAVDRTAGSNGVVVALFVGSGAARDKTGLYVFGPDRQLLLTESSLYRNSGLLLLSSSEHSMSFLVGDRGRTWRYTVTW